MPVDILGEPYTCETIPLPADDEGEVVATLVHRPADRPSGRAVLYVHGFADYFFQTGYAEWWTARGYDFYALDLRKYGRSMLPHQTPTYIEDLWTYFAEIDEAWRRIVRRDGHRSVVASGHSTGGLTLSLWANARRPSALAGMVLNAPWLDLQGSWLMRAPGSRLVRAVGGRRPRLVIPRNVSGLYARSLHADHAGEFDFDLSWKPLTSFPAYVGWLRAVREGHARVHRGLDIPGPILVLTSAVSGVPTSMEDPRVHSTDIVLDVEQIRRWSPRLGKHLTLAAIDGAVHDVFLSRAEPRARAYDELSRWAGAYLTSPGS